MEGLRAALSRARGGETILLADGDYGPLRLPITDPDQYARPVTIAAAHPQGARLGAIQVNGGNNLTFRDLAVDGGIRVERGSRDIAMEGLSVDGMIYIRNLYGFRIERTEVRAAQYGLILNDVRHFTVRGNLIGGAWEDVMRITGDSYVGVMEYNQILDAVAAPKIHPDLLQIFGLNGRAPHDLVIRRNLFWDDPATGRPGSTPQGLFITDSRSDKGYQNLLIEENLISVMSPNSIMVSNPQKNVVIRGNVLMANSQHDGGAIIRIVGGAPGATVVENNIFKLSLDKANTAVFRGNYVYGRKARLDALFSGPSGRRWQDFVPVSGSPIDFGSGFGAEDWLREMLSRQTRESLARAATPTPDLLLPPEG